MPKVAYVLGTRPEAIRSVRILQLLAAEPSVDLVVVNTGQHYDENMLSGFLRELEAPAVAVDLGVGSEEAVVQTALVMQGMGAVIADRRPRCVCVFGDTNSTLGAGLAAAKADVPLVHIEAGCRSFDMTMPEELNRRLVDHMSSLLLAVSPLGAENLGRERVAGQVEVVGDPQYDVFVRQEHDEVPAELRRFGLITLHRPENVDDSTRLAGILDEIAAADDDIDWIFPVHPRTRRTLGPEPTRIMLRDPLLYGELLALLAASRVCVTDSGGLQKEAFWARVPCVTVRRTTEWLETVWAGANALAQPGGELGSAIEDATSKRLETSYDNPYGDGEASERIVAMIKALAAGDGNATPRAVGAARRES